MWFPLISDSLLREECFSKLTFLYQLSGTSYKMATRGESKLQEVTPPSRRISGPEQTLSTLEVKGEPDLSGSAPRKCL